MRERISRLCSGKVSREMALALEPESDYNEVIESLDRSQAFSEIRINALAFPEFHYLEVSTELSMLGVSGAVLEGRQLVQLLELSVMTSDLIRGVRKQDAYPALRRTVQHLEPDNNVRQLIEHVLTESGSVRSSASKELAEIRRKIEDVRRQSNKVFDGLLRKYRKLGWLREYTESVYHDRRVLAVVAEYKNKLEGIIHGSSESGHTSFIEPSEMVGLNNALASEQRKEKEEERRILKELTKRVAEFKPMLSDFFQLIARYDLLEAMTKYARTYNGVRPKINHQNQVLSIKNGFHPVLLQKNREEKLETVPLDIELTPEKSMLVISGPNAGGKSIALKTVGLLQMMVQSGLLIPVHESSELPVFAQLLVDIGDDQSIEQQLSTYSSRLKKLKHFLRVADSRTLILLDEFGTGSDPELGGAIAESILEHLMEFKPWGVITTHFGNIKIAAENMEGLRNGCMLFNESTLEPEYRLKLDTPGSSYTFEVAQKIGMDRKVLNLARKKVDSRKLKLDSLLVDMQEKYKQLEHERTAVESERQLLKSELARLAEEHEDIQSFKASQQKAEFKRMVELGKKYEELLEFWNSRKDKKALISKITQAGEKKFNKAKKAAAKHEQPEKGRPSRRKRKAPQPIEVGDRVKLPGSKSAGTVIETDGKKALVAFGNMKLSVKNDQLILAMKKSKD